MKKLFVSLAIAAGALLAVSCDTKVCACYEYTSTAVVPSDIYVDEGSSCSAQSRGSLGNVGSRVCVEDNERLTPEQVAQLGESYKK